MPKTKIDVPGCHLRIPSVEPGVLPPRRQNRHPRNHQQHDGQQRQHGIHLKPQDEIERRHQRSNRTAQR